MRQIILLCFTVLLCFCGHPIQKTKKKYPNTLAHYNINGKVKKLTVAVYGVIKNGEDLISDNQLKSKSIETFDQKGNIMESISYEPNGDIKETHKYNDIGNPIEDIYYENNGTINNRIISTYDNKGLKTCDTSYDYKGKMTSTSAFKYDNHGNEIESLRYNADGSFLARETSEYDEIDNLIQQNIYTGENTIDHKIIIKYDEKGNFIESKDEYASSDYFITSFVYDKNNNIIEKLTLMGSQEQSKIKYSYKIFDEKKNWTKMIAFDKDNPASVIERVIEYYK